MKRYFPGEPILMNHWDGRKMVIVPFLSDDKFYATDEVDEKIERLMKVAKGMLSFLSGSAKDEEVSVSQVEGWIRALKEEE